jgi:hypothetical protein
MAVTTGVLTLLAVLDVRTAPRVLLGALLALASATSLRGKARAPVVLATPADKWSGAFAGLTLLPLLIPYLGTSTGQVLHLLSRTTDGGTHLQMVRAMAQERGLFSLEHPSGWAPGTEHYPLGWASNVWFVLEGAYGSHATLAQTIHLYGIATVLLYATVAYVSGVLVVEGVERLTWSSALLGLTALALALSLGFGLFLLQLNAYTALLALLALLLAVDSAKEGPSPIRAVVLLSCVAVVVANAWYLLAPVCLAVLVAAVARIRPPVRAVVVAAVVVAPLSAFPVLVGPPAGRQIGTIGPVFVPTAPGIVGLLLALLVGMAFVLRPGTAQARAGRRVLAAATVMSLLEAVALVVGDSEEKTVNYYGAKILLLAMVLGSIAAAAAIGSWFGRTTPRPKQALSGLALAGLVIALVSTSDKTLPPSSGKIHAKIDRRLLETLMERHPNGVPAATDVWFADGCYRLADRISTKWAYDLSLTWTDDRVLSLVDYQRGEVGEVAMIAARQLDPTVHRIELYVDHGCQPDAITALAKLSKVIIVKPTRVTP